MPAPSVLVAFQLLDANLRKIDEYLTNKAADAKKVRKLPSRRRTKSLGHLGPGYGRLAGTQRRDRRPRSSSDRLTFRGSCSVTHMAEPRLWIV